MEVKSGMCGTHSTYEYTDSLQQWRRHEVWTGGTDSGPSNPPTPNFDFSSDIGHFISKNLKKNLKILVSSYYKICKNRDFWGASPFYFLTEGTRPPVPPPPGSASMACRCCRCSPAITSLFTSFFSPSRAVVILSNQCIVTSDPFPLTSTC